MKTLTVLIALLFASQFSFSQDVSGEKFKYPLEMDVKSGVIPVPGPIQRFE